MGKIVFPPQFPFKPPSISMMTPSGRFAVNQQLCMSMTNWHPESWNPMWTIGTILVGLLSFFNEEGVVSTGSITTTRAEKVALAASSLEYNVRSPIFRKLFPNLVELHAQRQQQQQQQRQQHEQKHKKGALGTHAKTTSSSPAPNELKDSQGSQGGTFWGSQSSSLAVAALVGAVACAVVLWQSLL